MTTILKEIVGFTKLGIFQVFLSFNLGLYSLKILKKCYNFNVGAYGRK